MDEVTKELEKIQIHTEGSHEKSLRKILAYINQDTEEKEACVLLTEQGALEVFDSLLQQNTNTALVAEILAEFAKSDKTRTKITETSIIPCLTKHITSSDIDVSTQSCRALGNTCIDCDIARDKVCECGGVTELLSLLRTQLTTTQDICSRLRTVACGFLLNLSTDNEKAQKLAIEGGGVQLTKEYLETFPSDESICQLVLQVVGNQAETGEGRRDAVECNMASTLVKFMDTQTGMHLEDSILFVFTTLSESDEIKVQLANTKLCSICVSILKDHCNRENEESQELVKLSSDLLILLLTGDKSMDILYDNGEGAMLKESVAWLHSTNEHLRNSGALAIGNFARSDKHCVHLVKEADIVDHLLSVLNPEQNGNKDVPNTLQHGILSALRNLAIPAETKPLLLHSGVIDVVLPYMKSDMSPVQFKLLGLLRMIVDGQEGAAIYLGTRTELVSRVVTLCAVNEHAGVKGEANRLLAWLIKHSRSDQVMTCITQEGGVPCLVSMLASEHVLMQNEAILALTLISSTILDIAQGAFHSSLLTEKLGHVLRIDEIAPEILCNCLTLVAALIKSDDLKEMLKMNEVRGIIDNLSSHSDAQVQEHARTVLATL